MIYLVIAHTGEYSDHTTWPVRGFSTEAAAAAFAEKGNAWAKELGGTYWGTECKIRYEDNEVLENPFDSSLLSGRPDYTGFEYSVVGPIPFDNEDQSPNSTFSWP